MSDRGFDNEYIDLGPSEMHRNGAGFVLSESDADKLGMNPTLSCRQLEQATGRGIFVRFGYV
jgi:hypothetical protein